MNTAFVLSPGIGLNLLFNESDVIGKILKRPVSVKALIDAGTGTAAECQVIYTV